MKRMLLNRLVSIVDPKLIPEQARFRPGKSLEVMLQLFTRPHTRTTDGFLEDGFELGQVSGGIFVNFSALI